MNREQFLLAMMTRLSDLGHPDRFVPSPSEPGANSKDILEWNSIKAVIRITIETINWEANSEQAAY